MTNYYYLYQIEGEKMNIGTIICILLILIWLIFAIKYIFKNKNSCSCGCSACKKMKNNNIILNKKINYENTFLIEEDKENSSKKFRNELNIINNFKNTHIGIKREKEEENEIIKK